MIGPIGHSHTWCHKLLDCTISISGLEAAVQGVSQGENPETHISGLQKSNVALTWKAADTIHVTSTVSIVFEEQLALCPSRPRLES